MQRALSGRRRARLCSIVRWALPATCRGEADGAGGSRAHDSYQGALRFARQAIPNGPNAGMAKSGVIASPFRIANTVGLHWTGQVVADIGVFANDDLKLANCHDSAIYLVGRWHSSVHFAHLRRRACAQDSQACSACDANADGAISASTDKDVIQHDAFIARAKQSSPRSCPEQSAPVSFRNVTLIACTNCTVVVGAVARICAIEHCAHCRVCPVPCCCGTIARSPDQHWCFSRLFAAVNRLELFGIVFRH
jgi:hypothetical protein